MRNISTNISTKYWPNKKNYMVLIMQWGHLPTIMFLRPSTFGGMGAMKSALSISMSVSMSVISSVNNFSWPVTLQCYKMVRRTLKDF